MSPWGTFDRRRLLLVVQLGLLAAGTALTVLTAVEQAEERAWKLARGPAEVSHLLPADSAD